MRFLRSLFCGMILFNLSIHSMGRLELDNYVSRGLLIFLDDSEGKNLAAVSNSFVTALSQKAGPIIVSASLLHGVFDGYTYQRRGESPQQLQREFEDEIHKSRTGLTEDARFILLEASQFNDAEWYIKKINDFLYLLVPQHYLNFNGISARDFEVSNAYSITEVELKLGLKVNHMGTVNFDQFRSPAGNRPQGQPYFLDALYDASIDSSSIFCGRSDYLNKFVKRPLWTMYMEGHGDINRQIVGIRLDEFKKVLDFFENKINVELLVYTSCYAAGLNAEVIFKDSKDALERTYSFAIITHAITEAPTSELKETVEVKNNRLMLKSYRDFAKFLNEVTTSDMFDYEKAVENVFSVLPRMEYRWRGKESWANLPQIKLPGVEWFSVMAGHKDVVSIGSILAKTRGNKPLDVVNFFKADPVALLLFASDIPFELIISQKLSAIISMIPGDAVHTIAKISSSDRNVGADDIVNLFMKIEDLGVTKIFYIKEISSGSTVIHDVIVYYKQIPGSFGEKPKLDLRAYFKKDGNVFEMTRNQMPQFVSDKRLYEGLLVQFQEGAKQLKEFRLQSYEELMNRSPFSVIGNNAVATVDKITILKSNRTQIGLDDVTGKLRFQKSIVWVKEMSGFYEGSKPFDVLKLNYNDPVTLQDVVIDGVNNKILFSYSGKFYENGKEVSDYKPEYEQRMKQGVKKVETTGLSAERVQEIVKVLEQGIARGPLPAQPAVTTQPIQTQAKPITLVQPISTTQPIQTQPAAVITPFPTSGIPVSTQPPTNTLQAALQELSVRLDDLRRKI